MRSSIRGRLQLWYGGILLAALGGFAALLYSRQAWTTWDRVDRQLASAVLYLDVTLRGFPPADKFGERPPPPPPPMEREDFLDKKPPPRKKGFGKKDPPPVRPERLLDELDLPPVHGPGEEDEPARFVVWKADGTVFKASPGLDLEPMPDVSPELEFFGRDGDRLATMRGPWESTILVRRSVAREQGELRTFFWLLIGAGAVVLAVGLTGGYFLAGRIVRPIGMISKTASNISASRLNDRIDVSKLDSELVALAEVLNAMFARLQTEFDRQARFTADASHELRTPLAVLLGNIELSLSRPRSAEEYRSSLQSCQQAAKRMRALVDGLLTLARADADRLEMRLTPMDLRPLLRDALDQFAGQAESNGIRMLADWPEQPMRVLGDRLFLSRVLTNLVANALRYTPAGGGIRLAAMAEGGHAVLRVRDSGCGIAPEHRARIFERFYRVDDARARDTGGAGLGLAICRSIIEAHGGTIDVESEPGQGSTFLVRIPLA